MKKLTLNVLIATLVLSLLSFVCVIGFANAQTTPAAYDGTVTVYKDASNDLYLADGEGRTAIVLSIDAEYGASAKTVDGTGIRFVTNVDKAGYDALGDAKDKVSFGTLIGPADLNTSKIVHKANSVDYLDRVQENSWYEMDGDYHFNGALLYNEETKVSAYSRAQAGRGYMAIQTADNGTVYVYAKIAAKQAGDLYESNVRSVSYVMSNAFENGIFNDLGVEEQNALKKFMTVGDFEDVARSFNVVKGAWTSLTDDASITSNVLDGAEATSLTDVKFADVNDSFTVTVGGVEYSVNANGTVSISDGLALDMTEINGFDIAKTYTVRAVADDAGVSLWINDGDTCVFIDEQEVVETTGDNVVVLAATKDVVLSNVSISNVAELGSKNEVVLEEQSFEVYQKLSDLQAKNTFDALTANTLTVDLGSNVNSATAMVNETAIAANVSGGTVSIDGAQFGSKIYGKQDLVVDTPLTVYTQPLNIVTKYITDFTDFYNIMCYGGWATRSLTASESEITGIAGTCYTYGGYFVQTKNFNLSYNCTPRFRPHLNETDKMSNKFNGFIGIYDGGNYTIGGDLWQYKAWKSLDGVSHDFIGLGNSGLFGNVAESGKIQNLNINVGVGSGGNNQKDMGIVAKTFCGTLENVSIVANYSNNGVCTYAVNPIATYVAEATLTNVSIALDMSSTIATHKTTTSIFGSRYLMGQYSNSYKCQNALTLSNVHTYVKVSEFNTPILYTSIAWVNGGWGLVAHALGENLGGVTQHEYNSANTTLPAGLNADVWEISGGVPRLKAAN